MNDIINPFESQRGIALNALAHTDIQRAVAEVQASLIAARAAPRDPVAAMDKILNAFTRPSLAEVSQYQYSKGGSDVSGPSIRSAEAIAQQWGNIQFGFREISRGVGADGVGYSEVEAFAWDVENNTRRPTTFRVRHWRDKKNNKGYAITDEREIYELTANMAQRRVRACILAVIPGDVVESAMRQADVTLKASADTSQEAIKKMLSAFAEFGVSKEQIEARIQRRIDSIQPAQVVGLRKVYASLCDGMSTVEDWFEPDTSPKKPTELPPLSDDDFDKQFQTWAKLITSGKQTADQIIAMIRTKNKFSDSQITKLKGVK